MFKFQTDSSENMLLLGNLPTPAVRRAREQFGDHFWSSLTIHKN